MKRTRSPKGQPSKTEAITIRLTPRLKYYMEIVARKQHRTISTVASWAIERAINNPQEGFYEIEKLWSVDPDERIALLAKHHPELLTYEEELSLRNPANQ